MGLFLTFLFQVAVLVIADLLRPKPDIENAKPSGLGDFQFPTATEDRMVPLLWGTVRIAGPNTVWWGDLLQNPITVSVKTGYFSSTRQTTGFQYNLGWQLALCMGPLDGPEDGLVRVWVEDDVVGDYTATPIVHDGDFTIDEVELFGGADLGSGGVVGTMRFHAGLPNQNVSAYLAGKTVASAIVSAGGSGYSIDDILTEDGTGTATTRATFRVLTEIAGSVQTVKRIKPGAYTLLSGNPAATTVAPLGGTGCTLTVTYNVALQDEGGDTPAYHDICYLAPASERLYVGDSTSIKPWKFEVRRLPDGLALGAGDRNVVDGANPANVLYEILTNDDWGYGISPLNVDTANLTAAAAVLKTEGNGFSFILERKEDIEDLVRRVEDQIDGSLFLNPLTAKWQLKLVRDDYNILTVPEINEDNLIDLPSFTRGTWEGTTNQVRTPFVDAADDYKATAGFDQDMAGVRILGSNTSASVNHPGVKDATLANSLASRELRTLSVPLAKGEFIVDRSVSGLMPNDVFGFTNVELNFIRLPMRITAIDYGEVLDGRIRIEAVQDVFFAAAGTFDDPPNTGWQGPSDSLTPFPADEQIAFEAPYGLTLRDPDSPDPFTDKVYAAARRQGAEAMFRMIERNTLGVPAGAFTEFGAVYAFELIGELALAMAIDGTVPMASFDVQPFPDDQGDIEIQFPDITDLVEMGNELLSMIMIDSEFMLVSSATNTGLNVTLTNVYRGVLDSVQAAHAAGSKVHLIFVGSGISDDTILPGNTVDVKLLPRSTSNTVLEASATAIQFDMDDRTRRPIAPSSFDLNSTTLDATNVDLDATGSGEDVGVLVDAIIRRDFRTIDQVAALLADAATLDSTFPSEHTTTIEIEVRNGAMVLDSETGLVGTSTTMRQLDILAGLDTVSLPASLTFAVRASHTLDGTVYKSLSYLEVTSTIVSALIGKHAWGELDDAEESTSDFTVVADTVDHVFALSTAFASGAVEYELNGSASWVNLITAGGMAGTILAAALTNTDTIALRHLSPDVAPQKLLTMSVSGTDEAYAVLIS